MKKFFFALALICSIFTVTALAGEPKVNVSAKVIKAFENQFRNAANVEWTKVQDLFQARFALEDELFAAYFNAEGDMLVVARFLKPAKLPHALRTSLEEKAQDATIAYIFELTDDDDIYYYAVIQKGEKKEMLQSSGSKKWIPYTKIKI